MTPHRSAGPSGLRLQELQDAQQVCQALEAVDYLADHGVATAVLLAARLGRPLLVEGEPGVGKTALAKALARSFAAELIRLQCFEGIEAAEALYEWDWRRQLLSSRSVDAASVDAYDLYTPELLLERPLLRALRAGGSSVLLIDELDRADDQFDALLLEFLSDFTVTIPELGTVEATTRPLVIITSNRTRELHDALTRRCLYHWIDYPDVDREVQIIQRNATDVSAVLARSVAQTITKLRKLPLIKPPGAAEAIDWARSLAVVGALSIEQNREAAAVTVGAAVKNHDDLRLVREAIDGLLDG